MHSSLKGAAIAALALTLPGGAMAATAVAVTDVNVRSGPGPEFAAIGAIPADAAVEIAGCLPNSSWCEVRFGGLSGSSYGEYLATEMTGGDVVIVTEAREEVEIPTVNYDYQYEYETGDGTTVAYADSLGGLPADATTVSIAEPPAYISSYVIEHRREPVYLEGDLVIGAGVPEAVELYPIPDYDYEYAYVNEQPVLIEPQTRRVVYVYR